MASNLILNQVEGILQDAKEEGSISIDYSKIPIFPYGVRIAALESNHSALCTWVKDKEFTMVTSFTL